MAYVTGPDGSRSLPPREGEGTAGSHLAADVWKMGSDYPAPIHGPPPLPKSLRPVPTREWLQDKLVGLLEDAAAGQPDHQACATYAGLLFKLLPSEAGKRVPPEVSAAVSAALELEGGS